MARVTTAGQRHDSLSCDAVMADVLVVRRDGPVRRRPDRILADKANSSKGIRVADAGLPVRWDDSVPGLRRFHTSDPVGNRIELQERRHT